MYKVKRNKIWTPRRAHDAPNPTIIGAAAATTWKELEATDADTFPRCGQRKEDEEAKKQQTQGQTRMEDELTTTSGTAGPQDFFARNGLSVGGDKLLCDDVAQSLFPRHATAAHAWQGWCSYSVLAVPRRAGDSPPSSSSSSSSTITTTTSLPPHRPNPPPLPRDTSDVDEVSHASQSSFLLQFRPPRHALNPRTAHLARTVYGAMVPRVVLTGSVMLWPRAVPPAREFVARASRPGGGGGGGGGRGSDAGVAGVKDAVVAELFLDLCAMTLVPGTPYGTVQVRRRVLTEVEAAWQGEVVRGFAEFMGRGWRGRGGGGGAGLAAEEVEKKASFLLELHAATPGKLWRLSRELPSTGLRERAARVLRRYGELGMGELPGQGRAGRRPLPFTLNHGDVVPGNLLVDERTGRLNGLVDWAEAEVGNWGLGLYGLEFLLGYVNSPSNSGIQEQEVESDRGNGSSGVAWAAEGKSVGARGADYTFTYYAQAPELRKLFWEEVKRGIGSAFKRPEAQEAVAVVRDAGVLLWFGYAWDEGQIDRVVNERDDPREMLLLRTFLGLEEGKNRGSEKARL